VRGPVGSLARPENPGDFEPFEAAAGVTVYLHRALLDQSSAGTVDFQFGLLGRCRAVVENSGD
jgi:hypothetical protein